MTCLVLTRAVVFTLWTLDLWEVVSCFLEGVLANKENPAWGTREELQSNLVEQSRNSDLTLWGGESRSWRSSE